MQGPLKASAHLTAVPGASTGADDLVIKPMIHIPFTDVTSSRKTNHAASHTLRNLVRTGSYAHTSSCLPPRENSDATSVPDSGSAVTAQINANGRSPWPEPLSLVCSLTYVKFLP